MAETAGFQSSKAKPNVKQRTANARPLVPDIQNFAQDVFDTVREPLLVLDAALRVRSANSAFYKTFHMSPAETEGRQIYELGNGQWGTTALRTLLEDIVPGSSVFNDFVLEHDFAHIGRRIMLLNARRLHADLVLLAMEDVTERRRTQQLLDQIEAYAQDVVEVSEAPNGIVALEVMRRERPSLILLDLAMPEMDGFAFAAEVRRHPEWRSIPIVVLSAHDLTNKDRKKLNGNVETVILKHGDPRESILGQVRDLLADSKAPRVMGQRLEVASA